MHLILSVFANALALIITDWLLSGISIADFKTAVLAAIIVGLINTFIKPILLLLTAPLNFLTLGLFTFVVNAIVLVLASWILGAGFVIVNFWWAILAAAVLAVVSTALSNLLKDILK